METETIDLTLWQMAGIYALLLLPLGLIFYLGLGLLRETLWAVGRMSVQLLLVGFYLKVIFDLNSWMVTFLWILVMLVAANVSILRGAGLSMRCFFFSTLLGTAMAAVGFSLLLVMAIIQPTPVYDARYLIPIFGMTLGNCMRSNVLVLERFYNTIRSDEKGFLTRQLLGATLAEATRPYLIQALRAAVTPTLAVMATTGIVSLPGMMTGQILEGAVPLAAIKYQIAIMIVIFSVTVVGALLNVAMSIRRGFDANEMLRQEIFRA